MIKLQFLPSDYIIEVAKNNMRVTCDEILDNVLIKKEKTIPDSTHSTNSFIHIPSINEDELYGLILSEIHSKNNSFSKFNDILNFPNVLTL